MKGPEKKLLKNICLALPSCLCYSVFLSLSISGCKWKDSYQTVAEKSCFAISALSLSLFVYIYTYIYTHTSMEVSLPTELHASADTILHLSNPSGKVIRTKQKNDGNSNGDFPE
jgi:hypothetical protein